MRPHRHPEDSQRLKNERREKRRQGLVFGRVSSFEALAEADLEFWSRATLAEKFQATLESERGPDTGAPHLDLTDLVILPVFLSGPDPQYTAEALKQGVTGTVVAKCVITRDGAVRNCRPGKSHDGAPVDSLLRRGRCSGTCNPGVQLQPLPPSGATHSPP